MQFLYRLFPILIVGSLASACSFTGIGEPLPDPPPDQKDMSEAYKAVREAYAGLKLPGRPEMSPVHRVKGGYLAEWMMCVRNDDASKRQHYSFYFKDRKISEWRLSPIVEGCETQTFTPLPGVAEHAHPKN